MSHPILEIVDLHAAYGRIEVLRGVALRVPKGAVVALLGPNGAGKSTLVKVVSGQKKATSGDVHLGGVHVQDARPEQLARLGLCTVPEGRSVFPNLTVEENLTLMSYAGVGVDAVLETAYAGPHRPLVVGTDETGTVDVRDVDLAGPVLLVVGNETRGMSAGWREACDVVARIPMAGAASSLNMATAASLVLYEAMRQRSAGIGA